MRLRRRLVDGAEVAEMQAGKVWKRLSKVPSIEAMLQEQGLTKAKNDLLPYLQLNENAHLKLVGMANDLPDANPALGQPLLPVVPRSFRDFM